MNIGLKVLFIVLALVLVLFLAAAGLAKHYLGKVNYEKEAPAAPSVSEEELLKEYQTEEDGVGADSALEDIAAMDQQLEENSQDEGDALYSEDVFNLLLVGCDSRKKNGGGRSDAMILVSINRKKEEIYLTSLMRDIYTSIPGHQNNRINAAYAFGGAELLLDTIQQNFGVQVDKYASVDFYSFVDIIDILDGIDMEVSDAEAKVMNNYIKELNRLNGRPENSYQLSGGGSLHLNGTQALAYARVRYVGNADFERTNRQRKILGKVFEKAKKSDIGTLKKLLEVILPEVTTNLEQSEILSLALKVPAWLNYDMESLRIPADGTHQSMRVRGMSVLGIDFEANRKYLKETIYQ